MVDRPTPTKWIVAGVVLATVIVAGSVVVILSVGGDDGTTTALTSSTTATTAAPPTSAAGSVTTTTDGGGESSVEGLAEERIQVDAPGGPRPALVLSPDDLSPSDSVPVVMVLHGLGVSAEAMSRIADWREAVVRDRFVAVFPQGRADSWNLGPCCLPASLLGVDDVGFLDEVWELMRSRPGVDPERSYLTGFSNGGLMVYRYACDRAAELAAIAPMAGSNLTGCEPSQPLSLLHQHGDPDPVVPYGGGLGVGSLASGRPFPPVRDSVAAWAAADGCRPDPVDTTAATGIDRVATLEWQGCAEGTRVELVRITGVGHEWPRVPGYDPLAEVLAFFDIGTS